MNCTWYMTDFTGPKIGYIHLKSNDFYAAIRDVQLFIGAAIKKYYVWGFSTCRNVTARVEIFTNHPLKC